MRPTDADEIQWRGSKGTEFVNKNKVDKMPTLDLDVSKKEKEIEQLQNRCFVLSHGVLCIFCEFNNCKHKNWEETIEK